MDTSSLIMLAVAITLLSSVYLKSPEMAGRGLYSSITLVIEIAPKLIAAFLIAGLFQEIVPQEIIARWMGKESGIRGILIGTAVGTFTPGGPMINFPILASLYKVGIGVGPMVSFLTAWLLFSLQRIIMWELPFLGLHVVLVRLLASLLFPFLAGWWAQILWDKWKF